ncbi:MAG TPA: hypothetical protein VKW06_03505 [Candidatus Angelobacter sp.]|nr:hypothetical protein [Candidatus Angelobacter sp.]
MKSTKKIRRNKESGIAMIIALLALLLLAILGMGFMFMADTENSVNRSYKDSEKAYFASRAGLENVRAVLLKGSNLYTQAGNLPMPAVGVGGPGMIYVYNSNGADLIDPTSGPLNKNTDIGSNSTLDDELCNERFAGLPLAPAVPAGAPCSGAAQVMNGALAATYFHVPNPALGPTDIPNSNTGSTLQFKWVRITNKQNLMGLNGNLVDNAQGNGQQVCWNGTSEVVTAPGNCGGLAPQANPVWVLTSLALTRSGSRRMTQMEVAYTPPMTVPGTISTEAPVTLQGSYQIQSDDNCSCSCTTDPKTGLSTCTARAGFAQCYNQAHPIYTAGSINVNGNSGSVISNWGTSAVTASLQNQPWPPPGIKDVNTLINMFESGAKNTTGQPWNYTCSGTPNFTSTPAVYANCGTQTSQQFGTFPPNLISSNGADNSGAVQQYTYVPGSVKLTSASNGAGVLIIDGDLEINGGLDFYGLLLVRGKVSFTGGGSQAVNLYGSILAGEDVSATDQSMSDSFGGSINFKYDRCALNFSTPPGPPKMLATHEVMF